MPGQYKLTKEQEVEVASRYAKEGSVSAIAEEYGITRATLRRVVRRQGGQIKGSGVNYTPEETKTLANRWHAGESQAEIASSLGISQSVVSRILADTPRPSLSVLNPQRGELSNRWKGG